MLRLSPVRPMKCITSTALRPSKHTENAPFFYGIAMIIISMQNILGYINVLLYNACMYCSIYKTVKIRIKTKQKRQK